jgi:nicotinic acid phosphoribosyltransferase
VSWLTVPLALDNYFLFQEFIFLYLIVECTKKNEKLTNVALNKKAFQSSTYGGRRRKYYSSAQAVDGLSKIVYNR